MAIDVVRRMLYHESTGATTEYIVVAIYFVGLFSVHHRQGVCQFMPFSARLYQEDTINDNT